MLRFFSLADPRCLNSFVHERAHVVVFLIIICKTTFLPFTVTSSFHLQLLAIIAVTTAITVSHVMLGGIVHFKLSFNVV